MKSAHAASRIAAMSRHLFLLCPVLGILAGPAALTAAEPPAAVEAMPRQVDLRPEFEKLGLKPRPQGGRPTCSVFCFTGALEFAVARSRKRGERLSVEFANWAANRERSKRRDGGFFSEMWNGFSRHGICGENAMPYLPAFDPARDPEAAATKEAAGALDLKLRHIWIKEWDVKTGLSDAEFAKLKETIRQGWPVCGGFRWPKRPKWSEGVLQMCAPEQVFDGHSVLLTGFRDDVDPPGGGVFTIRDSGSGKDLAMPYAFAKAYMNDALWILPAPAEAEK